MFKAFGDTFGQTLAFELDIYQESSATKPHLQSLLEGTILDYLCRLQDYTCLTKVSELYSKIPPEYWINPNTNTNP